MTILLAEDEPQTAQLIEFKLRQAGFTVVHAPDGERALALVGPTQPALVLLDGLMPVMDGFEGCDGSRKTRAPGRSLSSCSRHGHGTKTLLPASNSAQRITWSNPSAQPSSSPACARCSARRRTQSLVKRRGERAGAEQD